MSFLSHALWIGLSLAAGPVFAADRASAAAEVRIEGARLSMHANGLPLRTLIATLERSGVARIEVHGDVSAITVSDAFDDADVAQALRRVLSAHSHLLIDRAASQDVRRIELIVLAPAGASAAAPMDASAPAVAAAHPAAAEPAGEVAVDAALANEALIEQLSDPAEDVRGRALEALKDTGDAIPVDAVSQVARDDASAERRVQALELLAERAGRRARGPLRSALADPAPAVGTRARELIEDWHLDGR